MSRSHTYDIGWAAIITYISPEFASGTATVEVTALTPADPLADPSWLLSVSGVGGWAWTSGRCECPALGGKIKWWDGFLLDGTLETRWFDLELFNNGGHVMHHVIATGTKRIRGSSVPTP